MAIYTRNGIPAAPVINAKELSIVNSLGGSIPPINSRYTGIPAKYAELNVKRLLVNKSIKGNRLTIVVANAVSTRGALIIKIEIK